jgi:pimeloyl-ACP methyl ester carboxylesterase
MLRVLLGAALLSSLACRHPGPRVSAVAPAAPTADSSLAAARVNGVTLHYVDRGKGAPVVFVHGGLVDYREWGPVADSLVDTYRTITYSRRYNYPNDNPLTSTDHSALVEAADLAGLIRTQRLGAVHLVGVSYGAYTALLVALKEPELVRSLVLVEPPIVRWLPDLPGGQRLYDEFVGGTWEPVGLAFRRGDTTEAMRITLDFFMGPGSLATLPAEFRSVLFANVREWQALTTSRDAFPAISRDEVRQLDRPVLMISGGRSYPMLRAIDAELERQLPRVRRTVVPDGTHDVCAEQPAVCASEIRSFLASQAGRSGTP